MIPFNQPYISGRERAYLEQVLESRHHCGDGDFSKRCARLLEEITGAHRVLLTTSCTAALEMAAILLEVGPGDEVIVPSFTFVSTANAFVLRGARPVFVDVRPDTLNLDETKLEAAITSKTKVIVPVHYGGVGCDMTRIMAVAAEHGIAVVEDNAHGLCGTFAGRPLGSFGSLATQSFHETKNFSCGEGGALVINDPALVGRAEIIREKGTDRSRFFRGQVDKYSWVDIGSSFLPSDLLAAMLLAQLEARDAIQSRRRDIWRQYEKELSGWAKAGNIGLPFVPEACGHPSHLFYLMFPGLDVRTRFIAHMRERGVIAVFHYLPLNISEMGRRHGGRADDCPVTESVANRLVRLPLFTGMKDLQLRSVIAAAVSFRV